MKKREIVIRVVVDPDGSVEPFADLDLDWSNPRALGAAMAALSIAYKGVETIIENQANGGAEYAEEYLKAIKCLAEHGAKYSRGIAENNGRTKAINPDAE